MGFFSKSKTKILEQTQREVSLILDKNLSLAEEDIKTMSEMFENYKRHNVRSFDSFFHVCIYSVIAQTDLLILLEKFRLSKRNYEKLLIARIIALTIIEYIDDINILIGRDLLKELASNNFTEFISSFKEISKKYSDIKKNHDKLLRQIRNNLMAHKSKDSLKLAKSIYEIDGEHIYELGLQLITITRILTDETTKVIYKMVEIGTSRKKSIKF